MVENIINQTQRTKKMGGNSILEDLKLTKTEKLETCMEKVELCFNEESLMNTNYTHQREHWIIIYIKEAIPTQNN